MKRAGDPANRSERTPTRHDPAGRRFVAIQLLRVVAAFLVVGEHLKNDILRVFLGRDPLQSAWTAVPFSAGVDIFFVISGFVIAHSSASLHARPGSWKTFLVRRLARVVPLYWLLTGTLVALLVAFGLLERYAGTPLYVLWSFLFVPAANGYGLLLPPIPLGWTLNYEMLFYALFALFVGLRQGWALALTAATLVALVAVGQAGLVSRPALVFWTDPIVLEFLGGMAIYAAVARGGLTLPPLSRLALVPVALALFTLWAEPDLAWRPLRWGLPAGLLVLAAVSGRPAEPARRYPVWEFLGDLSYSVYLTHILVLVAVRNVLVLAGFTQGPAAVALLILGVVALTLAASVVLNRVFERPVLGALRRRFDPGLRTGPGAVPGP